MKTLAGTAARLSLASFALASFACGGGDQNSAAAVTPATSASTSPPLVSSVLADASAPSTAPSAPVAASDDPQIAALIKNGLAARDAYAITTSLSDEVGPRIVGSAGFLEAVKWGQRTMTKLGLSNVHLEPVKVDRWERGEESASIVAPNLQHIELTALGLSPSTPAAGIEAEIVEVDSLAALDAMDAAKVKGKIVLFNKPMQRTQDGSGYGHGVDVRALGGLSAAKKGAAAALVRSITASKERFPHTGVMRIVGPKGSPYEGTKAVPAAAISVPDAEMIHRMIAAGTPVRVKLKLTTRTPPPVMTANVVGEVPGTTQANDVLLFGAHLDSWDLATGAQDDGAGCAIILEGAHLLLENHIQPARTIRVVLYAGEEYGGFGAKDYAEAHKAEADHIVAALEADEGGDRAYALRVLGDRNATFDALAHALAPLDIKVLPEDAHGGSDTGFLTPLGVPLIDLQQDMSRYFDIHHSKNDVMDQIDAQAEAQVATAFAVTATVLGKADASVGRVPADKRKAH